MPPKTKYDKLRDKWYSKLEKIGFKDIESPNGRLKSSSERFTDRRRLILKETNESYYALCQRFLNEHEFVNKREEIIWEYHTNGLTVRDIASTLAKARILHGEDKDSVHRVVKRLRQVMMKIYFTENKDDRF